MQARGKVQTASGGPPWQQWPLSAFFSSLSPSNGQKIHQQACSSLVASHSSPRSMLQCTGHVIHPHECTPPAHPMGSYCRAQSPQGHWTSGAPCPHSHQELSQCSGKEPDSGKNPSVITHVPVLSRESTREMRLKGRMGRKVFN